MSGLKVGERAVVAINDGRASLRLTRRADHPDRINFYVQDCTVEEAGSALPPLPVASGWLTLEQAAALKSVL